MSTREDYEALDRELRAERSRAAEDHAALEAELQRARERREALQAELARPAPAEAPAAQEDPRSSGLADKAWTVVLMLLLATGVTAQLGLFQRVVAPWRCESICGDRGLSFVSLVRRGGGGRGGNVLEGCVCRGEPTAECRANPRPGIYICDDGVTFASWFFLVRMVGSILLSMALMAGVGVVLWRRRGRAEAG